jgi:hypothetical protein
MITSESIAKIAPAFVAAQAEFDHVSKEADNDFFKSKYATLAACIEVVKPILAKHDLAVMQGAVTPVFAEASAGILIQTRLLHSSGEWMEDEGLRLPLAKNDPQGVGSAVTYGRRYSLLALLGVAPDDDDDGNAASVGSKPTQSHSKAKPAKKKADPPAKALVSAEQAAELEAAAIAAGHDASLAKKAAELTEADRFVAALTDLKNKAKEKGNA